MSTVHFTTPSITKTCTLGIRIFSALLHPLIKTGSRFWAPSPSLSFGNTISRLTAWLDTLTLDFIPKMAMIKSTLVPSFPGKSYTNSMVWEYGLHHKSDHFMPPLCAKNLFINKINPGLFWNT